MIKKLISWDIVFLILGKFLVEAEYVDLKQYPGERCQSKCIKGQSRTCYWEFNMEHYHAMGPACRNCSQGVVSDCFKPQCIIGDGFQKGVMSYNRMIPGPAIQVCQGDTVIIDLINKAQGTAAAIHWHGLHMVETPYMDGVPYATQCPILFDSTFRYKFYATQPGTHFYHSHSGHHKLNGQYGALIVRQPDDENLHIDEYDYDLPEHYVLISDWRHNYAEDSFPGLPKGVSVPESILINGRGTYVDRNTLTHSQVPCTIYYVKPGKTYRMRLINSYTLVGVVQMKIEKHSIVVISTDSSDTAPFETDTIYSNSGERFDFLFTAFKREGDYWMRFRGLDSDPPLDSFALIRYVNSDADYKKPQPPFPSYTTTYPEGDSLNHPQATCFYNDRTYCVADLTALEKDTDLVTRKPDYKFVFSFFNNVFSVDEQFVPGKYKRFDNPGGNIIANGIVNNISHIFPPQPVLTQYSEVDPNIFCEKSYCPEKCNGESNRECCHIVKVKTGSIVEMALKDFAFVPGLNHPMHLHGYRFALMGITNDTTDLPKAIQYAGKYRNRQPVWKDTVTVPSNGVYVARFRANNPGVWLLHCHYEHHLSTGMAFLFLIGEPNEWVQAPEGFPKCGNYIPGYKKGGY